MSRDSILISGAREHNLKNVTVEIPRNRLTVITGLSGSGKSSLAFDTLYAEGQRKYVESLSAYARQFLNQMQKPDVEHVEGLSPAISIEQRTAGSNPRSTVATATEIHDYLRLLYANVGQTFCPKCGRKVASQSAEQIVDTLVALPARTKISLLAPVVKGRKGRHEELLQSAAKRGYVRVRVDSQVFEMEGIPKLDGKKAHSVEIVVDRLIVTNKIRTRLTDSVEQALKEGKGSLMALVQEEEKKEKEMFFSEKNACAVCGLSFEELTPRSFSFNSPYGACPSCGGLGSKLEFDEDLVVPNKELSLDDGAVQAWRRGGRRLIIYYKKLLRALSRHYGFSLEEPFGSLSKKTRDIILYGSGEDDIEVGYWRGGAHRKYRKPFEGVIPNLRRRYEQTESEYTRQRLRSYMSRNPCGDCNGSRLKPEAASCKVGGKTIVDVASMSVKEAEAFFTGLKLKKDEYAIASDVLKEIRQRLKFLVEVGLDYLTLDRESGTLSGGEAQRIRLATQIGSGLVGVLYVLDEPTIGLHHRDNQRMIKMLKELRDMGNTVVVVEHDEEMIKSADYVIDLGPGAGREGGKVVFQGNAEELAVNEESLTARYLNGKAKIHVPRKRKKAGKENLYIIGAAENNLAGINVKIPIGLFTCVTGVSGSGKSTLVDDILKRAMFRKFYGSKERPGKHRRINGADKLDKVIVIDQAPIGRTPRSNPATYTGAFSFIRQVFAALPASKVRGYGPGRYSFNVKGGRCETCKGDGTIRIEMHFLPDVYVTCEQCGGTRYNQETLQVRYNGRNIAEVLAMTVDEALEFFVNIPAIERRLRTLSEVGLGYVQLGQAATTLSGGEAQRVKLSTELSKTATGKTLYLLDEPTTGLHFADIQKLLAVLLRLRDASNTVLVIEHNLDVIKCADYIIDLGPEGGDGGGRVVASGSPEKVAAHRESHTGRFLSSMLK